MMKKYTFITIFLFCMIVASRLLFAASEVVVAYANISARVSPLWIAQEKGFFTKYGVNVQEVYMGAHATGSVLPAHFDNLIRGMSRAQN